MSFNADRRKTARRPSINGAPLADALPLLLRVRNRKCARASRRRLIASAVYPQCSVS